MSSPAIDVQYVADLARLKLAPEEIATFQKQLSDVLGYVTQLEKVDVSSIEAEAKSAPSKNHLRADEPRESLTPEEALANAPQQDNGLIVVPKMVE